MNSDFNKYLENKRKELYEKHIRVLPTNELFFDRWEKAKFVNAGENTSIYDTSILMGKIIIGSNCWIGPYTLIEGQTKQIKIGNNVVISSGAYIYTHDSTKKRLSNNVIPQQEGPVTIGDFAQIGSNAVILPNVSIGHHSIISAFSMVKSSVPNYAIVGGIPAKIIGRVEILKDDIVFKYFSHMNEEEINDTLYLKRNDENLKIFMNKGEKYES